MGQVFNKSYIYGFNGNNNYTIPIQGNYSEWNNGWSSLACISGQVSADRNVMQTLAYTTGVPGTQVGYKQISYTNNGLNGTGYAGNQRYTITLNDSQRNQINTWLKNSTTGMYTLTVYNSILPSYSNNNNMIVFNLQPSSTTKIFIGLRGYYRNAKFTAQQSYNGCVKYGRRDLPDRYMYINATYCPHAKPNGASYLYDYNTNLFRVSYKYTGSLTTDYTSNMRTVCNDNNIPWNYNNSNITSDMPYQSTTTYRVISYDARSGSAVVENAISPYYVAGIDAKTPNANPGLQTPIIICCNETYYTTKILNLVTDNCTIVKHSYAYTFDPTLIPVNGNSGLTNKNGNVYGYGHVFYSVNYPYCIWLSDSTDTRNILLTRVGDQVTVSFGNYQTTLSYQPVITIAILSNDPNGICYYTVNQLTPGFDKTIKIYPFNPQEPLVNTSAIHTALVSALQEHNDKRWFINTSTASISGVFNASISNDTLCVTLLDITVNYFQYTFDSVNISIDIVPLNQSKNQYVVKTAISTSEFVDNISSTITLPWQNNGVNLLLPCSAQTYVNGTYLGVEALSVNQNTFGLALQYLQEQTTPPEVVAPIFNPYLEHYFGSNDIITESENEDDNL